MANKEVMPKLLTYSLKVEDSTLYLLCTHYDNAIHAVLYENKPNLGSYTQAIPINSSIQSNILFKGKHSSQAATVATMICKRAKKVIYSSVYLEQKSTVSMEHIRHLVKLYLGELGSHLN